MKCSVCGQESTGLTTFVNAATFKATYICAKCQAEEMAKHIEDPAEIDELIEEYEEMAKKIESIIQRRPEMPEVPPALAAFAMTPLSLYQGIKLSIAELKIRRMELMTAVDSDERLAYELKKSIEAENYEKAAAIRDKVNAKAKQPAPKKRRQSKK